MGWLASALSVFMTLLVLALTHQTGGLYRLKIANGIDLRQKSWNFSICR